MNKIIEKSTNTIPYPLFPLSVFILPGGKARLRIFEAKYLKMLSLISSHQKFVIQFCPLPSVVKNKNWGSLVEIKDFNQGEDGILEVDVECNTLVNISSLKEDKSNLMFAQVIPFMHWSQYTVDKATYSHELASTLNEIINNDVMLNYFYPHRALKNMHWVVARWIELLPVKASVKNFFISENSFNKANEFVESVIYR